MPVGANGWLVPSLARRGVGSPRWRSLLSSAAAVSLVAASLLCDECHALCPTEPVTLVTVEEDCKYQAACGVLSREGGCAGVTSVTELDFRDSDLSAISNNAFTGMAGLVTLNLAWNRITADGLPSGCFAGLTGLRNLYLHENALQSLPIDFLVGLTQLDKLTLLGNAISSMPADVYTGLQKMKAEKPTLMVEPPDYYVGHEGHTRTWYYYNNLLL